MNDPHAHHRDQPPNNAPRRSIDRSVLVRVASGSTSPPSTTTAARISARRWAASGTAVISKRTTSAPSSARTSRGASSSTRTPRCELRAAPRLCVVCRRMRGVMVCITCVHTALPRGRSPVDTMEEREHDSAHLLMIRCCFPAFRLKLARRRPQQRDPSNALRRRNSRSTQRPSMTSSSRGTPPPRPKLEMMRSE